MRIKLGGGFEGCHSIYLEILVLKISGDLWLARGGSFELSSFNYGGNWDGKGRVGCDFYSDFY